MKKNIILKYQFVDYIPSDLKDETLYISIKFTTVVHLCCCGCKTKVVTPLLPTDWKFIYDGKSVSLYPSIGNWSFKCRSHYWIRRNKVIWAENWSKKKIDAVRMSDVIEKSKYFEKDITSKNLEKDDDGNFDVLG